MKKRFVPGGCTPSQRITHMERLHDTKTCSPELLPPLPAGNHTAGQGWIGCGLRPHRTRHELRFLWCRGGWCAAVISSASSGTACDCTFPSCTCGSEQDGSPSVSKLQWTAPRAKARLTPLHDGTCLCVGRGQRHASRRATLQTVITGLRS